MGPPRARTILPGACLALLLFAPAVVAGIHIEVDPNADFSSYRTYAWHKGLPAAYPYIQKFIVDSVKSEMAALGFTEADNPDEADVKLATYAFGETEVGAVSSYFRNPEWNWGVISYDIRRVDKGTLIIALAENADDKDTLVWLAVAEKTITTRDEGPLQKKIQTITKKMFRRYPSR